MNPDLNSLHTDHNYVPSRESIRYQDQTTAIVRKKSLKNLKVEHYLRLLIGNGMQWAMIGHISEFFWNLVRRNLSIGSITQYFHGLNRFFLFLKLLDINRLEFVEREHLGAFIEYPNLLKFTQSKHKNDLHTRNGKEPDYSSSQP